MVFPGRFHSIAGTDVEKPDHFAVAIFFTPISSQAQSDQLHIWAGKLDRPGSGVESGIARMQ